MSPVSPLQAVLSAPQRRTPVMASTLPRFGFSPMLIKTLSPLQWTMSQIDSNKIAELAVTDIGSMVAPRTLMEYKERGPISARETFIREIGATFTNVFVVGWLGLLMSLPFLTRKLNPQAMNFKAYVDANTLEAYSGITQKALNLALTTPQTAEQLQRTILNEMLHLSSRDNMMQIAEYKPFLPTNGMIRPSHQKALVDYYVQHFERNNIEAKTHAQAGNYLQNRLKMARTIQKTEKSMLQRANDYAVKNAQLTECVTLKSQDLQHLGTVSLEKALRNPLNYMNEFFNRALACPKTGKMPVGVLSPDQVKMVWQRLFSPSQRQGFFRRILPQLREGLFSYAYKAKWFIGFIPFVATFILGGSTVYFNNLYSRKHLGENVFPGEEVFKHDDLFRRANQ